MRLQFLVTVELASGSEAVEPPSATGHRPRRRGARPATDVLTVPEIAVRLRRSKTYVQSMLRNGRLVGQKKDGAWVIQESALTDFTKTLK